MSRRKSRAGATGSPTTRLTRDAGCPPNEPRPPRATGRGARRLLVMRARPISQEALVEELAERISRRPRGSWVRVAVDGAPSSRPAWLADALVAPLRLRGRSVLRV